MCRPILFLFLVVSVCALSCKSESDNSYASSAQANAPSARPASSSGKSNSWTIRNDGIYQYEIGDTLNTAATPPGAQLNSFSAVSTGPDGKKRRDKAHTLVVNLANALSFGVDQQTERLTAISVHSKEYETKEGFSVGLTLNDFIRTYPVYEISYFTQSQVAAATTPIYPDVRFIFNPNNYTGNPDNIGHHPTKDVLQYTDFREGTRITEIRILTPDRPVK